MSDERDPLKAALATVAEAGGRVAAPRLKDGVASLVLDVTGLSAGQRAGLERHPGGALAGVPGVSDVRIAMTADKASRTIIAVGSGKGGVGKSTVAANLAVALARAGRRSAWSTPTFTARLCPGSWAMTPGPSSPTRRSSRSTPGA
jgi:ATP-binding protein involved in chromosome partitioning